MSERVEIDLDEKLPCDVRLPGVTLNRGVTYGTLLLALERRRSWSAEEATFKDRLTTTPNPPVSSAEAPASDPTSIPSLAGKGGAHG